MDFHLEVARFVLGLRARDPITLRGFVGAALRGGLGYALLDRGHDTVEGRAYRLLYDAATGAGDKDPRTLPRPFVLEPPREATTLRAGERFEVGIVLVGRAIPLIGIVRQAFDRFGAAGLGRRRSRFEVDRLEEVGLDGARRLLHERGGPAPSPSLRILRWGDFARRAEAHSATAPAEGALEIDFLTPTRIEERDDLVVDVDFATLVRCAARRAMSLGSVYCDGPGHVDPRVLGDASRVRTTSRELRWVDGSRFSTRRRMHIKLGGFVGRARFEGDLAPFLPLLSCAEVLHVGKGTTFGHGWIRVMGAVQKCHDLRSVPAGKWESGAAVSHGQKSVQPLST